MATEEEQIAESIAMEHERVAEPILASAVEATARGALASPAGVTTAAEVAEHEVEAPVKTTTVKTTSAVATAAEATVTELKSMGLPGVLADTSVGRATSCLADAHQLRKLVRAATSEESMQHSHVQHSHVQHSLPYSAGRGRATSASKGVKASHTKSRQASASSETEGLRAQMRRTVRTDAGAASSPVQSSQAAADLSAMVAGIGVTVATARGYLRELRRDLCDELNAGDRSVTGGALFPSSEIRSEIGSEIGSPSLVALAAWHQGGACTCTCTYACTYAYACAYACAWHQEGACAHVCTRMQCIPRWCMHACAQVPSTRPALVHACMCTGTFDTTSVLVDAEEPSARVLQVGR